MGSRKRRPRDSKGPKLKRRTKKMLFIIVISIITAIALFMMLANRALMPSVITIANQRSVVIINDVINESLISTIDHFGLTSENFFSKTMDEDGTLTSLSVDTVLVSQVAALLAVDISRQLAIDNPTPISVPIGMLTGIPMFANLGPNISVNIVPTGEARVDYQTSFASAGINQINFQVWLYIETNMRVVVPLQDETIPVSRRVPLVNTVFPGTVPEGMFLGNLGLH